MSREVDKKDMEEIKKRYSSPQVKKFGAVSQLTTSGSGVAETAEGMSGMFMGMGPTV